MGEEGDCDDFPSAFICLPALSRNYKHADSLWHHMTLHVIVVVSLAVEQVQHKSSDMGEMTENANTK